MYEGLTPKQADVLDLYLSIERTDAHLEFVRKKTDDTTSINQMSDEQCDMWIAILKEWKEENDAI